MAAIVRSEYDLPTVRVRLRRGERDMVEVTVRRGRSEIVTEATCGIDDIGMRSSKRYERSPDSVFRLPGHVLAALQAGLDAVGPSRYSPHNAIWLELASPRGYLHLLPWERLLANVGRPVLRLPNFTVRPQSPTASLEVALCASSPVAKTPFSPAEELDLVARSWVQRAGHDVRLHLFTDAAAYGDLRTLVHDLGPRVVVHDPSDAMAYDRPERTERIGTSTQISNPWLLWIADSLAGQALDVVHFIGHGYMSGDRGAVALASTPLLNTDRMWSRFVGGAELSGFLARVGAWSLILTSPPDNFSGMGLRELADSIAVNRPGVTATHDLAGDHLTDGYDYQQLGQLLHLVYAEASQDVAAMPSVSCWIHPRFVEYPPDEQDFPLITSDGRSTLVQPATQEVISADDTPSWVASGTRYLEQLQSLWVSESSEEPVDADAVAALESVSDLLERHAQRHLKSRERP